MGSTFCNRNPKAAKEPFLCHWQRLSQPLQPLLYLQGKKKAPGTCSAVFQISSVSIISPCTSTKICYLAQIQQSQCSMPNSASRWGKPGWPAFWYSLPLFCKKTISLSKEHFFFIIFKIAFMGGVTACKGRSGGKPLSILHLLLYVVLLQSQ